VRAKILIEERSAHFYKKAPQPYLSKRNNKRCFFLQICDKTKCKENVTENLSFSNPQDIFKGF
jgi:hypothetical protein